MIAVAAVESSFVPVLLDISVPGLCCVSWADIIQKKWASELLHFRSNVFQSALSECTGSRLPAGCRHKAALHCAAAIFLHLFSCCFTQIHRLSQQVVLRIAKRWKQGVYWPRWSQWRAFTYHVACLKLWSITIYSLISVSPTSTGPKRCLEF